MRYQKNICITITYVLIGLRNSPRVQHDPVEAKMSGHDETCAAEANDRPSGDEVVRLLRLREVLSRVGMSRAWVYLAISQGSFPMPLRIGPRAVAWRDSDIIAWQGGLPRSIGK
jgi:prophage regulatory protein